MTDRRVLLATSMPSASTVVLLTIVEQIWRELPAESEWLLIEGLSRANRLTVDGSEM